MCDNPNLILNVLETKNETIIDFKNKDKNGYQHAFIGAAGVYEYDVFWDNLDVSSGEIVSAYYTIDKYLYVAGKILRWYDTGRIDNYLRAKGLFEKSKQYSIPKVNGEFLYKVDDVFLKMSSDKYFIKNRIDRADNLNDLVPSLVYKGETLYSYKWVDGSTLYNCNDIDVWTEFLNFMKDKMWKPVSVDIKKDCLKFYKDKTRDRLDKFLSVRDESYLGSHIVNGVEVQTIESLLYNFDWNRLSDGISTKLFHGDLQFDNVIYTEDRDFCLLDWRQDFAGKDIGDVYYDLSKMYGGILMSYKLMKDSSNFSCYVDEEMVTYDYKSESKLNQFKVVYEEWVVDNGYDLDKVKTITSLIFLNMAPLHEKEFGDLLFFKSKQMLQELND